ncbi:hypothetical protein [Erythrobacter sp. KY5]|uniref:hypothetical protein n=1 Tax=Erythrobacter sp. KY5 TaxID=2011159 RepID=UPI001571CE8C|nr:hypothetical protein [Erythrobacter sp. KY5]
MSQGWPSTPQETAPAPADTGSKPKNVRMKLDTTRDCQKALARLIRAALAGSIETSDLSRYSNALMILARLIEGSSLEDRIAALEAKAK